MDNHYAHGHLLTQRVQDRVGSVTVMSSAADNTAGWKTVGQQSDLHMWHSSQAAGLIHTISLFISLCRATPALLEH